VRAAASLLVLVAGLSACGTKPIDDDRLPFYIGPDITPVWDEPSAAGTALMRVSAFSLTDQTGRTVTDGTLAGEPYVASFLFTSCQGICPPIVSNLRRVQDQGPTIVSISVTPMVDTVPVLARFGDERGIDPERWRLLTGSSDAIYELARESFFADGSSDGDFVHNEAVFLVDGVGRIRGVYNGMLPLDMMKLLEDAETLRGRG